MLLLRPSCLAVIITLMLVAPVAQGSPNYPGIIQTKLGLSRLPDCTLCHSDLNGGNGTIVTWFGLTTQDLGLQGQRPDLLLQVLAQLESDMVDSDGDGISDVEELRLGSDPNDGPGPTGGPPRPGRGCAMVRGGLYSAALVLPAALLGLVFLFAQARRRPRVAR